MRRLYAILVIVLAVGCGKGSSPGTNSNAQSSARPKSDMADLIERIEPAVILIDVSGPKLSGIGSGFLIRDDGLAVTNFHVLDGATAATARFADGKKLDVAGVVWSDPVKDLAFIQLAGKNKLPTLKIAAALPRKGESMIAFGAPRGLDFTATEGIVSAIRTESGDQPESWPKVRALIQTSTPISSGNSGGPLVNQLGEVVGINTMVLTTGQNLNFAVSALEVTDALKLHGNAAVLPLPVPSGKAGSDIAGSTSNQEKHKARLLEAMQGHINTRREKLAELRKQVDELQETVKYHIVHVDPQKEQSTRDRLAARIKELNTLADRPIPFPVLDPLNLSSGTVGVFRAQVVDVLQVLSKEDGECLMVVDGTVIKFIGMNLENVTDRQRIGLTSRLLFYVVGTTTYSTVSKSTNTVFEVACIGPVPSMEGVFTKEKVISPQIPDLTADEERTRNSILAERERAEQQAQIERDKRAAAAEKRKADELAETQAANMRAAARELESKGAAKLALAKKFIDKGDSANAKKWLQQIQKDFPNTMAATEAAELLTKLK